jgi:cyclopropane fatty-acyl-phospholipid synthase-like methyltransferase
VRGRLLDIGCGVLLRAHYKVRIGIEREERVRTALVHAIKPTRYLSVCGSLDDVPETFRFDAICAINGVFDVLDVQEAKAVMTRLLRRLTDSGILLFTVARGVVEDYPHRHDASALAPGATCIYSRPPHLLYATGPGFDGIGGL